MNKEEFIGKLQMVYVGEKNAFNEIVGEYDRLNNIINELNKISGNRMNTIIEIEKYCNEEKEDLIAGGEVCEDVLKIINISKDSD